MFLVVLKTKTKNNLLWSWVYILS